MNGNLKVSGDTQIQIALHTLLDTSNDKNVFVMETINTTLRKIASKHPNDVLQACIIFCAKDPKPSTEHVMVILHVMKDICQEHVKNIDGDTILILIDFCVDLMIKAQINEHNLQLTSSEVLVALGTLHAVQIIDSLMLKLTPGVTPHHMIPQTLGSLCSASAYAVTPYLKQIFIILLPQLHSLKQDLLKQTYAYSMGRFSEAVLEYTSNLSDVPDPTITLDSFQTEFSMAYDVLFTSWLNTRDPKVLSNVLYALAAIFEVLNGDNVRQYTHKSIQMLLQHLKKHKEQQHSVTRSLASVISGASRVDGTLLEPHLSQLLHTLTDLVTITPDYARTPDAPMVRAHSEALRCYERLCCHYTDHAIDHLLSLLSKGGSSSTSVSHIVDRVKALVVLAHIVISSELAVKQRLNDILKSVDAIILDQNTGISGIKVRMALMKVVVALAVKGFLTDQSNPDQISQLDRFLHFLIRLCRKTPTTLSLNPATSQEQLQELQELRQTSENALHMLCTGNAARDLEDALWRTLLADLLTGECTDACGVILKCMTHLVTRTNATSDKEQYRVSKEAFIRCLALLARPADGSYRGVHVLNMLKHVRPRNNWLKHAHNKSKAPTTPPDQSEAPQNQTTPSETPTDNANASADQSSMTVTQATPPTITDDQEGWLTHLPCLLRYLEEHCDVVTSSAEWELLVFDLLEAVLNGSGNNRGVTTSKTAGQYAEFAESLVVVVRDQLPLYMSR